MMNDVSKLIQEQVAEAYQTNNPVVLTGNGTKNFYGHPSDGTPLIVSQHQGVISYEPTELVITARAGTPLNEIEELLDNNGQQLAFEPPHFKIEHTDSEEQRDASLGGTIACGLSGPARANNGAARDFVLGCEIINGKAEQLKFGGQVMKNVAGYDVSRLICGSIGTLGVILNVSLKVLPKPEMTTSLSFSLSRDEAYLKLRELNNKPYPITASCYFDGQLSIRLAGNSQAIKATQNKIGGDIIDNDLKFWESIKEQQHTFFDTKQTLWRISTKPFSPLNIDIDKDTGCLTEWHGALHWVKTNTPAKILRQHVEKIGGHATIFRNGSAQDEIFHPLTTPLFSIHKNLKHAFDPADILNRNKIYLFNE